MQVIDIGREFAKVRFGRTPASGPHNATRSRDEFLGPAVARNDKIRVVFDSAIVFGASFLEECFDGLVA